MWFYYFNSVSKTRTVIKIIFSGIFMYCFCGNVKKKISFSLSNSRWHVAIPEAVTNIYWKKSIIMLAKSCQRRFCVVPRYLDKCKHPDKCKQFYQFIFACRSKPWSCFVNKNYIHMFLYLVLSNLLLVLTSLWCHKFFPHAHAVLWYIYIYVTQFSL